MNQKLSLKTPSKINLALRVLGKREDGYHEIETLFQMIAVYDWLKFEPVSTGVTLHCNVPKIPVDETNLVLKAAHLLQSAYPKKSRTGVRIDLDKTIPSGAGLGGGSSNAAGTLVALNFFWDLQLRWEDLMPLATEIGSDVPFFLVSPCAFGTGRGEQLTPLEPFKKFHLIVIYPEISIATAWAYRNLNLKLTKKQNNISILQNFSSLSDISRLGSLLENDFEPIVFKSYPEVLKVKNRLRGAGAEGVLMSGSGSAVFGVFLDSKQAVVAFSLLKQEFDCLFLTQTVQSFSEFFPEEVLKYLDG